VRTQQQIQTDIDNFGSSNTADQLLQLAAETKSVTTDRRITVATVNDLPDLANTSVELGTVVFVESIKVPVIAQRGCWTGLDNRVLRTDFYSDYVWSWGFNNEGRLGDNSTIPRSSPVSVVGGFTDWCQVSGGVGFSLGLRTNGTAWEWGTTTLASDRSSPVSVVGDFTDWCQVSAGRYHSLAIRTNGTAWGWGGGSCGRIGDNATLTRFSPVSVVGGFTDWCQVSAGSHHSLGLRTNGTVWGWGANIRGQLGNNSTISRSSPVSVVGGFTDWCQVSAKKDINAHNLGVRTNGTVWSWGFNIVGQLGDNSIIDKSSPVSVVGGFTDWCQVSAGESLGLRSNGTVWSWGDNSQGRLGDNSTIRRSSPVSVVGGFTDWCQVSAGSNHSLGVRTNGTVWSWGSNSQGQLGNDSTIDRSSPVSVVGDFTDWCQVSGGAGFSLGVRRQL
jgi:alpha-tubulin suppressor-like RCC1 family protein